MKKFKVPIPGTIGKSVQVETGLGPRVSALEAAIAALQSGGTGDTERHSELQGLQVGNDHPQYPLSRGRESIRGQWDFRKQVWASLGTAAAPGYAFTDAVDTGLFGSFTEGDPYFSSVVALLHFNGSDGSTAFTDSSNYARAVTVAAGTAVLDTTIVKYGSASLEAQAASQVNAAYGAEMSIATGDWTVEFWLNRGTNGGAQIIHENGSTLVPFNMTFNNSGVQANGNDGTGVAAWGTTVRYSSSTVGTWEFWSVTRSGSTFEVRKNGVLVNSTTYAGTLGENVGAWKFIMTTSTSFIDDFRMTVGVARTIDEAPDAQFPDSGDVVYESITVDGTERFRFAQLGQLGIAGATYGTLRQSFLSGGPSAPPTWSTLVHTDISDWDEAVQDTVGAMFIDSSSIDFTYTDLAGTMTATVIDEYIEDLVGSMVSNTTYIDLDYGDSDGSLKAILNTNTTYNWGGNHIWHDGRAVCLGTGGADLRIYHDGTNSFINNATGDLRIIGDSTGREIRIGAGGSLAAAGFDFVGNAMVNSGPVPGLYFNETDAGTNEKIWRMFPNNGLFTWATRTDANALGNDAFSFARSGTSVTTLTFGNAVNNPTYNFAGTGATRLTSDNAELQLGASQDLRLLHDGTNSLIRNDTGELRLQFSTTVIAALETAGAFDMRQQVQFSNVISPAQITANTDNYAPTGLATASVLRLSTDASRNLTGISAQPAGTRLTICNVGAQDIVLVHDATSTAANRFLCPGSANYTLNGNDSVDIWYDTTSARWRVIDI